MNYSTLYILANTSKPRITRLNNMINEPQIYPVRLADGEYVFYLSGLFVIKNRISR